MFLISIIVPVYNVENYLKKCIDSLINQTYKNIEIILIDDSSSDLSGQICDEYALKDKRIIVEHNNINRGVSYSRNRGIDIAKGEYISFIDSDDSVDFNYIESLSDLLKVKKYDFVICDVRNIYINSNIVKNIGVKGLLTGDFYVDYYKLFKLLEGPCGKLYKRELIKRNNIYFMEKIMYGEDRIFNFNYCKLVNTYRFTNKIFYKYFHRENYSLSNIKTLKTFNDILYTISVEKDVLNELKIKDGDMVLTDHVIDIMDCFIVLENEKNSYKDFKKRLLKLKAVSPINYKASNFKRFLVIKCLNNDIYFIIYLYYMLKYYVNSMRKNNGL